MRLNAHRQPETLPAWRTAAASATLALLAGCGGGGGGSDDPEVVVPTAVRVVAASAGSDLNADNALQFAGAAARLVLGSTGNTLPGGAISAERERPLSALAAPGVIRSSAWWAQAAMRRAATPRILAVESVTEPCPFGGSLLISADDGDGNQRISRGDVITVDADQCILEPGTPAADGRFSFTINIVELDRDEVPTAIDASGSFTAFRIGDLASLTGSFRLWTKLESLTTERLRVSYRDISSTLDGQTTMLNIDLYGTANESGSVVSLNGGVGIGGQVYAVVQDSDFTVPSEGQPTAGAMRLLDANGDALQLAVPAVDQVSVTFTPSGATAPTVTLPVQTWDGLLLPTP